MVPEQRQYHTVAAHGTFNAFIFGDALVSRSSISTSGATTSPIG
jgi:hypothetical protein